MTMYLSLRIGILLLLRIVNCRWVVSDDAVRRQFLSKRKDLQFMKAMVQSRHLGVGHVFCSGVRENRLTHVFVPCWNRGRRLPAEEERFPAPADGSKTGREKSLENPVNATLGKVNPKWS